MRTGSYPWLGMDETGTWDVIVYVCQTSYSWNVPDIFSHYL